MHIVGSVGIAKSEFSSRRGEDYNSHNSPGHTESPDNESSSSSSFHFLFLFLLLLLLLPLVILILLLPPHLAGFEAAQMFLSSREVPDIWKMDMSQILDSSSSDDEDDEEEKESDDEEEGDEEKKKKHIKEEVSVDMTTGVTDAAGKVRYLRLCVSVCVCVCLCLSPMKSQIQKREITSCSSSTSSWRTEVRCPASLPVSTHPVATDMNGRLFSLAEIIKAARLRLITGMKITHLSAKFAVLKPK